MLNSKLLFIIGVFLFFCVPKPVAVLFFFGLFFNAIRHAAMVLLLGYFYVAFYLHGCMPLTFPEKYINKPIEVEGRVSSFPTHGENKTTFILDVFRINQQSFSTRVQVADYDNSHRYTLGEKWKLKLKAKNFRNFANEGSANYKQKQLAKKIMASAYVKKQMQLVVGRKGIMDTIRQWADITIDNAFSPGQVRALMKSLLIGNRSELTFADWQRFSKTGTSHLIAISGLHVGLVSGVCYWLMQYGWRFSARACNWIAAPRVAALVSLFAAWGYSALAGFSIPTQRACVMIAVFLLASLINRHTLSWHNYILALLVVLLINPLSIYLPGFYLSFFVVFILILFFKGVRNVSLIKTQLVIWVLMLPIGFYFFSFYTLASIPANLLSIPLFSFGLLPTGLLLLLSYPLNHFIASQLAWLITTMVNGLYWCLDGLKSIEQLHFHFAIAHLWQVLLLTGSLVLLLYTKKIKHLSGVVLSMGLVFIPWPSYLKLREVKMDILDVGQGLSVVIQTKHHVLVYDTGGTLGEKSDLGRAVVYPFLNYHGIHFVDAVLISHEDMDHRGGLKSLQQQLTLARVYRNNAKNKLNCLRPHKWQWDGVTFELLAFSRNNQIGQNNHSCVLSVSNQFQRVLLPGDIERSGELQLVKNYQHALKATALVSPHHGSKTSSTEMFLDQVQPQLVFISSGFQNRYRMPHQAVLRRYEAITSNIYNTAHCGQISWLMRNSPVVSKAHCFRSEKSDLILPNPAF